jgi:hypothetical protein
VPEAGGIGNVTPASGAAGADPSRSAARASTPSSVRAGPELVRHSIGFFSDQPELRQLQRTMASLSTEALFAPSCGPRSLDDLPEGILTRDLAVHKLEQIHSSHLETLSRNRRA